jgi:hypothetical protein
MQNQNGPFSSPLGQPRDLKAETLDNRVQDANLYGQLQGGLGHLETGRGDSTAQGLGDALSQTLRHVNDNRTLGDR